MSIRSPLHSEHFRLEYLNYGSGAVGSNFTFPAFTEDVREIIIIAFTFITNIAAANRQPYLWLTRNTFEVCLGASLEYQAEGLTRMHTFAPGNAPAHFITSYFRPCPIPPNCFIIPGDQLNINVINKQMGDQIISVIMYCKVYPTGKP